MNDNFLKGSDKEFWHRYLPKYENKLKQIKNCNTILEFGVFKGQSIRWLNNFFPKAEIYGSDILDTQKEWPVSENIKYLYVDQGKPESIKDLFNKINSKLDLIIEDGSHIPVHQKNCLVESLQHMTSGGIYILEDIHTSHPEHINYTEKKSRFSKKKSGYISALHLLLCFEHLLINNMELENDLIEELSTKSLFTKSEISLIFNKISDIEIYKRATLPHKCYSCGSSNFNYHNLKCKCGVDIYSNSDSMTAILTIK